MSVATNLSRIREALADTNVTLIAVSKYVSLESIQEAFNCGITEFAESRLPEALDKQEQLPPEIASRIRWHFIGHLQRNKVKKVLGRFVLIHSVDSIRLLQEIASEAAKMGIVQPLLLQVKIADDPGKSGFSPQELKEQFAEIIKLPGIKIEGLMTMTPLTTDKTIWKTCFQGLNQLRQELEQMHSVTLKELSMGMSDDWIEAVKYGATMIRLGRAIFEKSEN